MPYITQSNRERIDPVSRQLNHYVEDQGVSEGELNYILTSLILSWLGNPNYKAYNAAIGVLECVKQEFYRRSVAPYEDQKRDKNCEVYPDGR